MKILFATNNLARNRSNIVLFERLWRLDSKEHEVTLLSMSPFGSLKKKMPAYVRLVTPLHRSLKKEEFDSAASFSDGACAEYVANNINANDKSIFLYNFDSTKTEISEKTLNGYKKFNLVYTSDFSGKASFLRAYPELAGCTYIVPDTIERNRITRLASKEGGFDGFEGVRLLSVGSLLPNGGHGIILDTAAVLKERRFYFKWYIIGTGPASRHISSVIEKEGLSDCVELLNIANYYPYLDECDLFIDMNRKGIDEKLIREIKLLDKSIVAYDCDFNHDNFGMDTDILLASAHPVELADGIEYMITEIDQQ